ncbi:MAG TPA: hypothetical protein VFC11_07055 [Methylocella sp.]|nr:hypothetical protein [Methylocella sp.]
MKIETARTPVIVRGKRNATILFVPRGRAQPLAWAVSYLNSLSMYFPSIDDQSGDAGFERGIVQFTMPDARGLFALR